MNRVFLCLISIISVYICLYVLYKIYQQKEVENFVLNELEDFKNMQLYFISSTNNKYYISTNDINNELKTIYNINKEPIKIDVSTTNYPALIPDNTSYIYNTYYLMIYKNIFVFSNNSGQNPDISTPTIQIIAPNKLSKYGNEICYKLTECGTEYNNIAMQPYVFTFTPNDQSKLEISNGKLTSSTISYISIEL